MKFLNADFLTIQTIASLLTLSTATFIFRSGDPSYLYNVDLNGDPIIVTMQFGKWKETNYINQIQKYLGGS